METLIATALYGKTIRSAKIEADAKCRYDGLNISFTDGVTARIADEGQVCCEHRSMDTDDYLADMQGEELRSIELLEGNSNSTANAEIEIAFLTIRTDRSVYVIATHNHHNGAYGGFNIEVTVESAETRQQAKDAHRTLRASLDEEPSCYQ